MVFAFFTILYKKNGGIMLLQSLPSLLAQNPYPGRGIVMGRCSTGEQAFLAYFIMGRSENSRNRVLVERDGTVYSEAANPAKVEDPSLIIYTPVRKFMNHTIVTNGDQTDTIYSCLERGIGFTEALRTRSYEPDAPHFTPRISGMIATDFSGFSYTFSILKSAHGQGTSLQRFFFEYPQPLCGQGHFIHTYEDDSSPLPTFSGEPHTVSLDMPLDTLQHLQEFGLQLWNNMNQDNRIALFVRSLHLNGEEHSYIFNRFNKV